MNSSWDDLQGRVFYEFSTLIKMWYDLVNPHSSRHRLHRPFSPKHIHKLRHFPQQRREGMTMRDSGRGSTGTYNFQVDTKDYSFGFHGDLQVLLFVLLALYNCENIKLWTKMQFYPKLAQKLTRLKLRKKLQIINKIWSLWLKDISRRINSPFDVDHIVHKTSQYQWSPISFYHQRR